MKTAAKTAMTASQKKLRDQINRHVRAIRSKNNGHQSDHWPNWSWTSFRLANVYADKIHQVSPNDSIYHLCFERCMFPDHVGTEGLTALINRVCKRPAGREDLKRVVFFKLLEEVLEEEKDTTTCATVLDRMKTQGFLTFRSVIPACEYVNRDDRAAYADQHGIVEIIGEILKSDHGIDIADVDWLLHSCRVSRQLGLKSIRNWDYTARLMCEKLHLTDVEDWIRDGQPIFEDHSDWYTSGHLATMANDPSIELSRSHRLIYSVFDYLGPKFANDFMSMDDGSNRFNLDRSKLPSRDKTIRVMLDSTPLPKDLVLLCIEYLW